MCCYVYKTKRISVFFFCFLNGDGAVRSCRERSPGMSRRRWRTQSRDRQPGCHTLALCSLTGGRTPYPPDMPAWSHATPLQWHSYKHTHTQTNKDSLTILGSQSEHCLLETVHRFTCIEAPEEKHESLYEGSEVVVLVDGALSVLFNSNIPKQLSNTIIPLGSHFTHFFAPKARLRSRHNPLKLNFTYSSS